VSDLRRQLGDRLKAARQGAGLSSRRCAELAQQAGLDVTHQTVINWERGRGRVRLDYAAVICRELDLHPAYLLTGDGPVRWSQEATTNRDRAVVANWLRRAADQIEGHFPPVPAPVDEEYLARNQVRK
jgi:transcriptional regulator with XRE-family HTH domain